MDGVTLKGGPMDQWVVQADAPALSPDWTYPGHPGHYEQKGDVATWVPEEGGETLPPADPEAARAALKELLDQLAPFTGNFVDLDLFAGHDVVFAVRDVKGKVRKYPIPSDPPFPTVLTFCKAHDDMKGALQRLSRAQNEAAAQSRRNEYEKAWTRTVEAFLPIVQILNPRTALEDLTLGLGPTMLENWMDTCMLRFNRSAIERLVKGLTGSDETPAGAPKARRATRRGRKGSSKRSGG